MKIIIHTLLILALLFNDSEILNTSITNFNNTLKIEKIANKEKFPYQYYFVQHKIIGTDNKLNLAVSGIMYQLDSSKKFDILAEFFDKHQPGKKISFYDEMSYSIDEGTEIFIFDDYLDSFRDSFCYKETKKMNRNEQQQVLRDYFKSYKDYRQFIETVAWSLILNQDQKLPKHLRRYDLSSGSYSIRYCIDVHLSFRNFNLTKVVEDFKTVLDMGKPPEFKDRETYSFFIKYQAWFKKEILNKIIETPGSSTDNHWYNTKYCKNRYWQDYKELAFVYERVAQSR